MVARTSPTARQKNMVAAAALNPNLVRETVKKVDRCLARLQELQYSVSGGRKVVDGVSLSPRSTKSYLRTSLRCKQENLRIRKSTAQKSPPGKFTARKAEEERAVIPEWRAMSITTMLLSETVAEIQRAATRFAKPTSATADPKTPVVLKQQQQTDGTPPELRLRRKREKHRQLCTIRSESLNNKSPSTSLPRARARITFRPKSPTTKTREPTDFRHTVSAHRVSNKNRAWPIKKNNTTALLFPNATFHPSPPPSSHHHYKRSTPSSKITTTTKSPDRRIVVSPQTRRRSSPHNNKFLIKSPSSHHRKPPPPSSSITKSPDRRITISPRTRRRSPPHKFIVKSPVTAAGGAKKLQQRLTTTPMEQQQRQHLRSFSPVKLAIRLVSPLKSRISAAYNKSRRSSINGGIGSGITTTTIIPGVVTTNHTHYTSKQFDSMIH